MPVSLQDKKSKEVREKGKGKRGLTKKAKNELIDRLNILYYQKDIESGVITQEEALEKVGEALQEKKKWEDAGYSISMNKTESVGFYNPDRVVIDAYGGDWDALNIYKKHKIKMVIPDVVNTFYTATGKVPAKYVTIALKSPLPSAAYSIAVKNKMKGWTGKGAVYDEKVKEYGGAVAEDITSLAELIERLDVTQQVKDLDIKVVSLGFQKELYKEPIFIFDGIDKSKNARKLISVSNLGIQTLYDV